MKNIYVLLLGLVLLFAAHSVRAQETGGQVILDLAESDDEVSENGESLAVSDFIKTGYNYINDVKDYNDLLAGEDIKKDFSQDIRAKYPKFSDKAVELWQKSVRTGIQGYRFYELVKQKVVDWVMKEEMPLVVDDDQYEMGEDEEYIETDNPIVIQKFRKVVAYSFDKKDRLAAEERRAELYNLEKPSKLIPKYKKALIEKDWKTLFGLDWHNFIREHGSTAENTAKNEDKLLSGQMVSEFTGIDDSGVVSGAVLIRPKDKGFMLLRDYEKYKGLSVDFSQSENIKDLEVGFVWPQTVKIKGKGNILGYSSDLPIYFSAKAQDTKKDVVIKAKVQTSVCLSESCLPETVEFTMPLKTVKSAKLTTFASYVMMVKENIPHQDNAKHYDFEDLVWEPGNGDHEGSLRLRVKTKNSSYFNAIMLGENAKYFGEYSTRLNDNEAVIRFKALDKTYNPVGNKFTFWVMTNSTDQYIQTMTAEAISRIDVTTGKMNLGIVLLAFVGGILLNLMPCVFPVLSLKLLAFTKFGGQNAQRVRTNFICNSGGILCSFAVIAAVLTVLKLCGQAVGWGMQFQNIYFLIGIIWIVTLFLAHVLGFIHIDTPQFAEKFFSKDNQKERIFEFLSGMFLVLLSTPCMAPYLGTALGVALTGTVADIWVVVIAVGAGVAFPYILIACFPKIAAYMPKPGKWLNFINLLMIFMLVVTLGWLVSILVSQSAIKEIWHWILYITVVLGILYFRNLLRIEVDKLSCREVIPQIHRRNNIFFGVVLVAIIICSGWDALSAAKNRKQFVQETKFSMVDEDKIKSALEQGKKVLVKVGADWCLTCKYNDAFVFDTEQIADVSARNQVVMYDIDWTHYNAEVLNFMQKYGRAGLPFYILFSPKFSEGIVLPEMPEVYELEDLLEM